MTASGRIVAPNSREATAATAAARSSLRPSLAMVAEVPMQIGCVSGQSRSRTRRTSIATSAPCRPR